MDTKEALEAISTGNTIWETEYAREVCQTLGVAFKETLVQDYGSHSFRLGYTMFRGPPKAVYSLDLAAHVTRELGVIGYVIGFHGRDSQAREYARVVAEKLAVKT